MAEDLPRAMGRLGSTYGLKGYLKVQSFTDDPESLFSYTPWYLGRRGQGWQEVEVEDWRMHGDGYIVKLNVAHVKEEAALLTNMEIGIKRSSLPALLGDEIYLVDLEGCKVIGIDEVDLGTVKRVVDHGASPIMVLTPRDRTQGQPQERLIPYVRGPIVTDVDLDAKTIRVNWGEDY